MASASGLTKAEAARAVEVARSHPLLAGHLDADRQPVLLRAAPPRRDGATGHAVVGVHDPTTGGSLVVEIDLKGGRVVEHASSPAALPLSAADRQRAEHVAAADERVTAFLAGRPMDPLTRLYFRPGSELGARHAIVFLRPVAGVRAYAVVDLGEGRVAEVLSRQELTGEES